MGSDRSDYHDGQRVLEHKLAKAFNAGSDARLLGDSRGTNPYRRLLTEFKCYETGADALQQMLLDAWHEGWDQADSEYGLDARFQPPLDNRPRWPFLRQNAHESRRVTFAHGATAG